MASNAALVAALVAVTSFLVTKVLPAAQVFAQQPSDQSSDPLINRGGEATVYVGVFAIILAIAAIVGIVSRRIEHAVFTALGLSLILIAVFFFTSR